MDALYWISLGCLILGAVFAIFTFWGIYNHNWSEKVDMGLGIPALAFVLFGYSASAVQLWRSSNKLLAGLSLIFLAGFIVLSILSWVRAFTKSMDGVTIGCGITSIICLAITGFIVRIGFVYNLPDENFKLNNFYRGVFAAIICGSLILYFLSFVGFYSAYFNNTANITMLIFAGGLFCGASSVYLNVVINIFTVAKNIWWALLLICVPIAAIILLAITVAANQNGWDIGIEAGTFFASMCLQVTMIPLLWYEGPLPKEVEAPKQEQVAKATITSPAPEAQPTPVPVAPVQPIAPKPIAPAQPVVLARPVLTQQEAARRMQQAYRNRTTRAQQPQRRS